MNVHENRMKLTPVIIVNIIEPLETFVPFINLLFNYFSKKYVRIKIEVHKILGLMSKFTGRKTKLTQVITVLNTEVNKLGKFSNRGLEDRMRILWSSILILKQFCLKCVFKE